MADDFVANAGVGGDTFGADDVGGVKYPRSKLIHGADGINDGDVSTVNPLPVELTDDNNTVVADIETLAGAVTGTEMQVDVLTSALPTGASTSANQTTGNSSLSTIAGDTTSIDGKITACNTGAVTISAALPAGTNGIGKLTANSGVDIGDVDVTSIASGSLNGPGNPTIDSYAHIAINLTTANDQVLVSSAASKQIWVYGYGFTCGDADGQTVSLQDEDDTAITGIMEFAQYGGIVVPPSGNFAMPVFKLATDKDLEVDITGGDVDGWLAYAIVSV